MYETTSVTAVFIIIDASTNKPTFRLHYIPIGQYASRERGMRREEFGVGRGGNTGSTSRGGGSR